MRDPRVIRKTASQLRILAILMQSGKPRLAITESEAADKVAEALEWAAGEDNDFQEVAAECLKGK